MGSDRSSLATGFGAVSCLCGLAALVTPIVLSSGRAATPESRALAQRIAPELAVGGILALVVGIVVGYRYGNMERYHDDYDEETGRIEGHRAGWVINPLLRESSTDGDPHEEYVLARGHLVAFFVGCFGLVLVAFWWVAPPDLLGAATITLVAAALGAIILADWFAKHFYEEYP